jgi:hypothetical protein
MAKLHELLAVEDGLQSVAKKINEETVNTFHKKDEHFVETTKETLYFDAEEASRLNTTETSAMVTTVVDKLAYSVTANVRAWDAYLQKGVTNCKALADIVVDSTTLVKDVPGTVLLGMETKLTELRNVYAAIPTLAPGPTWEKDSDAGRGVYRAQAPDIAFRTKKTIKPVVMAQATEHHPAQVQAVSEDVSVARIITSRKSGMMTSADKSELLARLDRLLRAVKRARQRANGAEVEKVQMGKVLFDYLHAGIVS